MNYKQYIDNVSNFPIEGIEFKDITSIFKNPIVLENAINDMANQLSNLDFDIIVGAESRGIWFAIPIAMKLNKPVVFARKAGKLPKQTASVEYGLEYGKDKIEIQKDDIPHGAKVIVIDDLLATGGTINAVGELVQKIGGEVIAFSFFIELMEFNARTKLNETAKTYSLVEY
jgi:adenine phosphoribosyltransferase